MLKYKTAKKNGKLPDKLAEETPWNKLCVDLIGPYKITRKGKEPLILEAVTMIYPITRWFEVTQYSYKKAKTITKLLETTWLARYPWTAEITYDQGGEFLGPSKAMIIQYLYYPFIGFYHTNSAKEDTRKV